MNSSTTLYNQSIQTRDYNPYSQDCHLIITRLWSGMNESRYTSCIWSRMCLSRVPWVPHLYLSASTTVWSRRHKHTSYQSGLSRTGDYSPLLPTPPGHPELIDSPHANHLSQDAATVCRPRPPPPLTGQDAAEDGGFLESPSPCHLRCQGEGLSRKPAVQATIGAFWLPGRFRKAFPSCDYDSLHVCQPALHALVKCAVLYSQARWITAISNFYQQIDKWLMIKNIVQ